MLEDSGKEDYLPHVCNKVFFSIEVLRAHLADVCGIAGMLLQMIRQVLLTCKRLLTEVTTVRRFARMNPNGEQKIQSM